MVSATSFLPQSPAFYEQARAPMIVRGVRNFLTGRICLNWKEKLLTVSTVYTITQAVLLFFSGCWFASLCHFTMGAFLAVLRKEIKDITSLENRLKRFEKENDSYRLANAKHHQLLKDFDNKLQFMASENNRFSKNNDLFETGLARMGSCMTEIATALQNGHAVSEDILRRSIGEFDSARIALDTAKGNIEVAQSDHRKQIQQLFDTASQVNDGLLKKAGALQRQYETTTRELGTVTQELRGAKEERRRLKAEVDRLEKVRGHIVAAADKNHRSADRVESIIGKLDFLVTPLFKQKKGQMIANVAMGAAVAKATEFTVRKLAEAATAA